MKLSKNDVITLMMKLFLTYKSPIWFYSRHRPSLRLLSTCSKIKENAKCHPLVETAAKQRKTLQDVLPFLMDDMRSWNFSLTSGTLKDPEKRLTVSLHYFYSRWEWLMSKVLRINCYMKRLDSADQAYLIKIPGLNSAVIRGPKGTHYYILFSDTSTIHLLIYV